MTEASPKPHFSFARVQQPLSRAFDGFSASFDRILPPLGYVSDRTAFWELLQTFLTASYDSHMAVGFLLSKDRPRPYLPQAAASGRIAVEALGHVLYLAAEPKRAFIYWRDAYRTGRGIVRQVATSPLAADPQIAAWLASQAVELRSVENRLRSWPVPHVLHLKASEQTNPESIVPSPSVGKLLEVDKMGTSRKDPLGLDYLAGSARTVFEAVNTWYAEQSSSAHLRIHGIRHTRVARRLSDDDLDEIRTNLLIPALTATAAIMSEIEMMTWWVARPSSALAELWKELAVLSGPAAIVYALRYR